MNKIDKKFNELVREIKNLSSYELYYRMRLRFDNVPVDVKNNCINFFNKFKYWGIIDIDKSNYEEIELKLKVLKEHTDEICWLYNILSDYRSKSLLFSIINNWYSYDFISTSKTKEYLFDDYFDLDIISECSDEVLVDLGSYTGDTVISFINNYGINSFKRIYCYEITLDSFNKLKDNLKNYDNIIYKNMGVGDKDGYLSIDKNMESDSANKLVDNGDNEIKIVTLDDDIKEKITIIKADIEGFEKKALYGAWKHIKNDHPKLLISVYHKNEDLYEIAKIIYDIDDSYKFYLRYNSSPLYPTEITLIAI